MKERDAYWDIVKGIGIVSIVIGHSCEFLSPYVYLYHLVIFFFVGGYFYDWIKYAKKPFVYVGKLFQGVYFKYVLYTWLLILLHNFNVRFGLYYGVGYYSLPEYLVGFANALCFYNPETFGGALWFVPVYIVVLSLLGISVYFSQKLAGIISHKLSEVVEKRLCNGILIAITIVIGVVAVYLNLNGMELAYHIHTALVVFPIVIIAMLIRQLKLDLKLIMKPWMFPMFLIIMYLTINYFNIRIELSQEQIAGGMLFYPISLIGICFCLSLANGILRIKYLNCIFSLLGKYSFSIMAMHFFVIKLIDRVYSFVIGEKDPAVIGQWVTSWPHLWLVYMVLGSLLPMLLAWICHRIVKGKKVNSGNVTSLSEM